MQAEGQTRLAYCVFTLCALGKTNIHE